MKTSTSVLSFLSLATGVASQITAEKRIELFHEVWDPVTKGHFSFKNLNPEMFADDVIFRDPVGGNLDVVGKEAVIEDFHLWESAFVSFWWEVRSEFVQQDGILHVFMNVAAVTHNADKSGTCSLLMDALIRQELNEDGKIKLFEFYHDIHGTGILKCMGSTAESQEEQEL